MRSLLLVPLLLGCKKDRDPTAEPIEPYDPLPLVDPFVATGGTGFEVGSVNPGPLRPFGMVKAGPDTRASSGAIEFLHCAGYHYDDTHVVGFSHTHAYGMGVGDYGAILVMPRNGWDPAFTTDKGRAAPFDHAEETASPGYYAVTLGDDGVRVELTATDRAAMHRWTFPSGAEPVAVIDLGHVIDGSEVRAADLAVDLAAGTVTGFQNLAGSYSNRFGGLQTHFAATFDPAPIASGTWTDPDAPQPDTTVADGTIAGAWLVFPPGTTEVIARVAVSYVDGDGAIGNLDAELPDGTAFDDVRAASEQAWRDELSNVRVSGGTETDRTIFHTALYHAYQMPSRMDDADGRYRGLDGEVHTTTRPYYSDFSLWDTFRTQHPWLIVARPDRQQDMAASLVQHAKDGGSFDRWPLGHGYTGGMVGSPTDQVLAESYLKGLRDWDVDAAWAYSVAHASGPVSPVGRSGIEGYRSRGYVAWEDSGGPAALTLEYAWNDHALWRWGEAMGAPETAWLATQKDSWRNTWDPEQGFMLGRYADGSFTQDLDPKVWANDFVEGGAWQYVWMVPQDVDGLIELQHGGDREAWLQRLDDFWALTYQAEDTSFPDPYYWHGNEPDIHYGYLASLAGAPDRSAEPIRWIRDNRYFAAPNGLDGNDDAGTLSAWYLWSAIGLFPVAGTDVYAVGAPWFERAEIDLAYGETLVIRAPGSSSGPYVQSARLGEDEWTASTLTHADWLDAGELVLELGPEAQGFGE